MLRYAMKRFAVISCSDAMKWGYSENTVSRYSQFYKQSSDEQWIGFHATRGNVPTLEALQKLDGIVLSGSISSVNDNDEWIVKLQEFIKAAGELDQSAEKRPKIIGICFGHQLIAKALGGTVGLNPDKDFVLQTGEIRPTNEGEKAESIKGLFDCGSLRVIKCHSECITELPKGAISLGTSATCKYEIVQFRDNILGIQSHPEMCRHEAEELILPGISKRYNWSAKKVKQSSESFKMEADDERVKIIVQTFLKS